MFATLTAFSDFYFLLKLFFSPRFNSQLLCFCQFWSRSWSNNDNIRVLWDWTCHFLKRALQNIFVENKEDTPPACSIFSFASFRVKISSFPVRTNFFPSNINLIFLLGFADPFAFRFPIFGQKINNLKNKYYDSTKDATCWIKKSTFLFWIFFQRIKLLAKVGFAYYDAFTKMWRIWSFL